MNEINQEWNKRIEEFWNWFSLNELKLYNTLFDNSKFKSSNPESTPMLNKLSNRLQRANKSLTYEFFLNRDEDFKFEFYISPNGNKEVYPFLINLIKAAPLSNKFIFYPFKQAHKDPAELKNMGLGYAGQKLSIKDIYFKHAEEGNARISLDIYFKGYDGNEMQAAEIMFYLLDKVIGEYYVSNLIGGIQIHNLTSKSGLLPLHNLPDIVDEFKIKYNIPSIQDLLTK